MTIRQRTGERMFRAVALAAFALFAFAFSTQEAQAQAMCPSGADIDVWLDEGDNYCELCGVGEITTRVRYADNDNAPITNIRISEDLSAPGLEPILDTTIVRVSRGVT